MDEAAVRALAARFFDAIEAGDIETVSAIYARDAVVWHNFDGKLQSRDENLATLRMVVERLADRSYDERRVEVFADGFLQQHVLRATQPDGVRVGLPAAIVCRLRDDKIVRLDEYLDSAQVAAFRPPGG